MVIRINNQEPNKLYVGNQPVQKVYRGSTEVWSAVASDTSGNGRFSVWSHLSTRAGNMVEEGDVIEMRQEHLKVIVQNPQGFATNNLRDLSITVDFGERYNMPYDETHPYLSPLGSAIKRPAGNTLGFYRGYTCGHTMEGRDLSGDQILTASYNEGNGQGIKDNTVTVTVSDGIQTKSLTFTARIIHSDIFYRDINRTLAPQYPDTERRGIIYFSRDGDFSDAPAEASETSTQAGIYHFTVADGRIDPRTFFHGNQTSNGGPNYPWSSGSLNPALSVRFKAGQEFELTEQWTPSDTSSTCLEIDWWEHNGANGNVKPLLHGDGYREWDQTRSTYIFRANGVPNARHVFKNIRLRGSDWTPSDPTKTEWWNVLNYSNKTGSIGVNTRDAVHNQAYDGDVLTNGAGVYVQVIGDTGSALLCRQVVDRSDVDNIAAQQAYFSDGDTLTGPNGSVRFVAAGSRQDRTERVTHHAAFYMLENDACTIHRCEVFGFANGIASIGQDGGITACFFRDNWNYQITRTTSTDATRWSVSGTVLAQRADYPGDYRDFNGATVSPNRNTFNAIKGNGAPDVPADNNISHACIRVASIRDMSFHNCILHGYGGHGRGAQPLTRLATDGDSVEGDSGMVWHGCDLIGGGLTINFGLANNRSTIFVGTPRGVVFERCNVRANFANSLNMTSFHMTNWAIRNCLIHYPAGIAITPINSNDVTFIGQKNNSNPDYDDTYAIEPVVEFNTLIFESDGVSDRDISWGETSIRAVPIILRNNAVAINASKIGAVDSALSTINDTPANFDAQWRPRSSAVNAYRTATGQILDVDFDGTIRPAVNASKGAQEPA